MSFYLSSFSAVFEFGKQISSVLRCYFLLLWALNKCRLFLTSQVWTMLQLLYWASVTSSLYSLQVHCFVWDFVGFCVMKSIQVLRGYSIFQLQVLICENNHFLTKVVTTFELKADSSLAFESSYSTFNTHSFQFDFASVCDALQPDALFLMCYFITLTLGILLSSKTHFLQNLSSSIPLFHSFTTTNTRRDQEFPNSTLRRQACFNQNSENLPPQTISKGDFGDFIWDRRDLFPLWILAAGWCRGKIDWVMTLEIEKWDEGFQSFLLRMLRTWQILCMQSCYKRLHNLDLFLEGMTWVISGPWNLHTSKKKDQNSSKNHLHTRQWQQQSNNTNRQPVKVRRVSIGRSESWNIHDPEETVKGRSEGENNLGPLQHGSRGP